MNQQQINLSLLQALEELQQQLEKQSKHFENELKSLKKSSSSNESSDSMSPELLNAMSYEQKNSMCVKCSRAKFCQPITTKNQQVEGLHFECLIGTNKDTVTLCNQFTDEK
uniref:Uncharacterized protein n=1 Tax=Vibrio cholerae non-O1/non-O139 TaxID=156539 RepID=A0A220ISZ3_VIBCL|nr:hypothetical protein [Vibrio cholerae non-O1/non-O139]